MMTRRPPPLPSINVGHRARRPPPGVLRPPPRPGGIRGLGAPPELRRRLGAVRAAPGAPDVAESIRAALRVAQKKLLDGKEKVQTTARERRAEVSWQ
jgi:hypothetical protein